MDEKIYLAVNGTLMQGLALNNNMLNVGAVFIRETETAPVYKLWSINDSYPAMIRVASGGKSIAVEIWEMSLASITQILLQEPPGLCIGKVTLTDGEEVLGVLGESILCEGKQDISKYSGWRAYTKARNLD